MLDRCINILSGIIVIAVLCGLIVLGFEAVDREMAQRESHNRIHRHDLIGGGRGR
jgi:hypothetical protein